MLRFHPTISIEQFRDSCLAVAAVKPKVGRKGRTWKEYVSIALVCLACAPAPQFHAARVPLLTAFAIFLLFWLLARPLARHSYEKSLQSIFSEEQTSLNDQFLTIAESGISCDRGQGKWTSHHTWKAFKARIDMPDAFLFLPSPNSFVRVPKDQLTPAEIKLLIEWSGSVPLVDARPNK